MVNLTKYLEDLEEIDCDACGARERETFCQQDKFNLPIQSVICRQCGLMYINPRPTKELYAKFNESDYRKAVSGTDQGIEKFYRRQIIHTRHNLLPFYQEYTKSEKLKTLLDIGCSYGGIAKAWGQEYESLQMFGIEPVLKNAEFAERKVKIKVTRGLFEDYVTEQKFDLIIFSQALNHTLDPMANLMKIKELLADEGEVLISVWDSVSELLNRPLEKVPELCHPYMFCRESIKYIVEEAGLEIIGFSDRQLDGGKLGRRDIPGLSFPRTLVLARRAEAVIEPEKPDYKKILARMKRNIQFYEQWEDEINKWYRPNLWRRIYRYLVYGV
jgi:SAM-dependent methyltransferase